MLQAEPSDLTLPSIKLMRLVSGPSLFVNRVISIFSTRTHSPQKGVRERTGPIKNEKGAYRLAHRLLVLGLVRLRVRAALCSGRFSRLRSARALSFRPVLRELFTSSPMVARSLLTHPGAVAGRGLDWSTGTAKGT